MSWYCAVAGQRVGPLEEARVRSMIQSGQVQAHDLVWSAGHGPDWVRADSVPAFAPLFAPPPLPPAVPPPTPPTFPPEPGPLSRPFPSQPGPFAPQPAPVPSQAAPFPAGAITPNETLMAQARQALAGRWGEAIGVTVLLVLVSLAANALPYVGWILGLVVGGPLALGSAGYFLATARRQNPQLGRAFSGFERFGPAFTANVLVTLFCFLWGLLLIVPGIVAAYRYALTFYVLEDNPSISGSEAIERSKAMMAGHKWRLFALHLRFLGWALLCVLTLGIGFVVLVPYMATSTARFYDDLRGARPPG